MTRWLLHEDDPVWDWSSWLHPEELREGRRYRHPGRYRQWQHGRVAAKKLLCDQATALGLPAMEPARIWIHRAEAGWPQVRDEHGAALPVSLSIAHTTRRAFCAARPWAQGSVGVDMEAIDHRPDSMLEDFYSAAERAALRAMTQAEQDRAATIIWTVKEAVLKAARTGLADNAKNVSVALPTAAQTDPWQPVVLDLPTGLVCESRYRIDEEAMVLAIAEMGPDPTS